MSKSYGDVCYSLQMYDESKYLIPYTYHNVCYGLVSMMNLIDLHHFIYPLDPSGKRLHNELAIFQWQFFVNQLIKWQFFNGKL